MFGQRLFFQNALTGEYYTGEVLGKAAKDMRGVSLDRFRSRAGTIPLSRSEAIMKAYERINHGQPTDSVPFTFMDRARGAGLSKEEVSSVMRNAKTTGDLLWVEDKAKKKAQEKLNQRYRIHRQAKLRRGLTSRIEKSVSSGGGSLLVSYLAKRLKIA